jgi:hypothetical protein
MDPVKNRVAIPAADPPDNALRTGPLPPRLRHIADISCLS